jgi:hypothetical protein
LIGRTVKPVWELLMAAKKAAGRLKCAGNGIEASFRAKEKIMKNIYSLRWEMETRAFGMKNLS